MYYSRSSYRSLPSKPGVYVFYDKSRTVLYVGKAKDLKKRVSSYFTHSVSGDKTGLMVSQMATIGITVVESEIESLLLEASYIKKFMPKYNTRLTDGKSYPYIRITVNNTYPAVMIARRTDDKGSLYLGPYPDSKSLRMILRIIRRIFPHQSSENHPKRVCLYHHLGLCPCYPVFDSSEARQEYKKTTHHIISFLEGNTKKVIRDLQKERDTASKHERFEKAALLQKQIDAIQGMLSSRYAPFEYEVNPNLSQDLRQHELQTLQSVLQEAGTWISYPQKIECYDISNISGKYAVGSMVVFTNGEKNPAEYRRFRIRGGNSQPNDFAMMQEVLRRRIKHVEWQVPDLIVIDGGKGQVSAVQEILQEMEIQIPIIGLAKRYETIITRDFREISLSKSSPALHLTMRIRDEAHRFAVSYHRKLRSKFIFA